MKGGRLLWLLLACECLAFPFLLESRRTTSDTQRYIELAMDLGTAIGFDGASAAESLRPLGYPSFLALTYVGLHNHPLVPIGLQILAFVAIVAWAWRVAPACGVRRDLFLALVVAYPFALVFSSRLMSEGLFIPFFTGSLLCLATSTFPSWKGMTTSGALLGMAMLMRPVAFYVAPFVLVGLVSRRDRPANWWRASAAFAGAFALVALPMTVRNEVLFDRWSPNQPTSPAPASLYLASWQQVVPQSEFMDLIHGRPSERLLQSDFIEDLRDVNARIGVDPLTPPFSLEYYPRERWPAVNDALRHAFVRRLRDDPLPYVTNVIYNGWRLFHSGSSIESIPGPVRILLGVWSTAVWLAWLIGLAISLVRGPPSLRALAIPAAALVAGHMLLHTEARYTAAVRIVMLLHAGNAIQLLIERLGFKWRRQPETGESLALRPRSCTRSSRTA